jgi:hypothetical protein
VPHAVAGLLWIPILIAFGGPPGGPTPQVILYAEVEHFAFWRAVLSIVNLLIPLLLLGAIS